MSESPAPPKSLALPPGDPGVFKVAVRYDQDAHEPQIIAVTRNSRIRTAALAEAHCLATQRHLDRATHQRYRCVEAKAVRPEPYPTHEAPPVAEAADALAAHSAQVSP